MRLKGRGKITKKRATSDEPIFLDKKLISDLENLIKKISWPYKSGMGQLLGRRDRALFAFLILTGLRVTEALSVKRKQLRIYENRIEAVNIKTVKHGLMRKKIILPKVGSLKGLTYIFEDWLKQVTQLEDHIFPRFTTNCIIWDRPISRIRAYQVFQLSGKFPHWARAVCETIYGRWIFKNDAWKLKQFMGLKRLDSTAPYVQGSWEENEKNIYVI